MSECHAVGHEARSETVFRGLCWCGWRGEWRDGERAHRVARRDAVEHVRAFRQVAS